MFCSRDVRGVLYISTANAIRKLWGRLFTNIVFSRLANEKDESVVSPTLAVRWLPSYLEVYFVTILMVGFVPHLHELIPNPWRGREENKRAKRRDPSVGKREE